MQKAIIFDLNGIFIKSPKFSDRFTNRFAVQSDEFLSALKEIMVKIRMPNAGDAFSYWQPFLEKWNLSLTRKEFFDFWFKEEKIDSEMTELAKNLKNRGVKIFILSNNFLERTAYYDKQFPFLKNIADKIYYSWQTGFIKTMPEAFLKLLGDNNLLPDECVFFDDSQENIDTAESLGIHSFLFESSSKVKNILKLERLL